MPTEALYLHDSSLYSNTTTITSVTPRNQLSIPTSILFKIQPPEPAADDPEGGDPDTAPRDAVVATASTIFHPQGGGQPSDTGTIVLQNDAGVRFNVEAVRKSTDAAREGDILHYGTFASPELVSRFTPGEAIVQGVQEDKRILHSRIHDGGHILSLAVRSLIPQILADSSNQSEVGSHISELKAQHYPGAAFVEFRGLIDGKWKDAIQAKCDELVSQDLAVKIGWCSSLEEMQKMGVSTAATGESPQERLSKGEKIRIVEIEGVGSYPCGGTHVARTGDVGELKLRKISRSKGISKLSYEVG